MARMVLLETVGGLLVGVIILSMICHYHNFDSSKMWKKRVLLTDVSSDVGENLAYEYAKLKTKLAIMGSDRLALEDIADKCNELGAVKVEIFHGNMSNWKFRKNLVPQVEKRLGGLDVLILNHLPNYHASEWAGNRHNITQLKNILDVHFVSYVEIASNALPLLKQSKGNIGVITSLVGKVPLPLMAAHTAAEAALRGFFPALRQELQQRKTGVSVTSIALGFLANANGTNAVGKENPFFNPSIMTSVQEAAEAIITYVGIGKTELSFPFLAQVHVTLHNFFPSLYEELS